MCSSAKHKCNKLPGNTFLSQDRSMKREKVWKHLVYNEIKECSMQKPKKRVHDVRLGVCHDVPRRCGKLTLQQKIQLKLDDKFDIMLYTQSAEFCRLSTSH